MRTILLPAWGRGTAHALRALLIAGYMHRAGWRAIVVLPRGLAHGQADGPEIIYYPDSLAPADMWSCWANTDFLRRSVEFDVRLVSSVNPDVVVHDTRLSTPVACQQAGVPCASVCQHVQCVGFGYPGLGTGPTWTTNIDGFNAVLFDLGLPEVQADLRELYLRGFMLIPSVPEMDPLPVGFPAGRARYIGPLTGIATTPKSASGSTGTFFYRTVPNNDRLDDFVECFRSAGDVYIATGSERSATSLRSRLTKTDFIVRPFFDLARLQHRISAAVIHGGHGMCLSCLQLGLPSVVLPGTNPERTVNGNQLQALRVAACLSPGPSFDASWDPVDLTGNMPDWEHIRNQLDAVRSDVGCQGRLASWSRRFADPNERLVVDTISGISAPHRRHVDEASSEHFGVTR